MRTQILMPILLTVDAALVLIGLFLKQDVWFSMTCYWFVLLLKNISDVLDENNRRR